ncbi:MAG TPA: N-methyl-L-tryptophan oxidase [Candidatus Acidoferrales bacterium]|nr:N-methyl-L-tryptophan oxidase [Candidatus Acidoferrales bacterium]
MQYDAAVLGLGGMGSAAVAHLARRGLRVAGIERFSLMHELGASTGRTRIIRKAYFEDTAYVPLLQRAYTLWRELEELSQTALLDCFGVLMIGRPDSTAVTGVTRAADMFGIPTEPLDAVALRARYPRLALHADEVGILEPDAGVVFPERAIAAHLTLAQDLGAQLYDRASVRGFQLERRKVRIRIEGSDDVITDRLAVCAGAWTDDLLGRLGLPLRVQRNVQYWYTPPPQACGPAELPAFFLEREGLPAPLYAIPDLGDGFKAAFHGFGEFTWADTLDRNVHGAETAVMRDTLGELMPGTELRMREARACMYTMTPDANFGIGFDPQSPRVAIACGFSGHGFKFAPVIGEILTQMLLGEAPPYALDFLRLDRFTAGT